MTPTNLTPDQERNFNLIELRVTFQRSIELLDDLLTYNVPTNNKKLRAGLKATYAMLEKETKRYNELFEVTPEGATAFFDICEANAKLIMSYNLLDKNLVNKAIASHRFNPKAVEGILDKVLKEKQ